jgi:hypothetical protein
MLRDTHTGNVRRSTGVLVASPRRAKRTVGEKERLYKEGPVGELKILAARAAYRLRKKISKAKAYALPGELRITELLEQAANALEDAVLAMNKVPKSWTPAKGSVGGAPLELSAVVVVKGANREARIELTDPSVRLRVTKMVGGKVACRVMDGHQKGMLIVVPRLHLERAEA